MLLHFLRAQDYLLHSKKNKEKIFHSYECEFGAKKVKLEQCEALNNVFKEWLLNLRSGNVSVNGPLHKEKAIN